MNVASSIVSVVLMLIIASWALYTLEAFFGGEDFASDNYVIKKVVEIIYREKNGKGVLYDLGSGHGKFSIKICKLCPDLKVYGVDNSKIRIFLSRARSFFPNHRPTFFHSDIFKANLSQADFVYIYLDAKRMPGLEEKLKKGLKPGVIVITNKVSFPNWEIFKKESDIFIYKA